jgi:hypothetical protein
MIDDYIVLGVTPQKKGITYGVAYVSPFLRGRAVAATSVA